MEVLTLGGSRDQDVVDVNTDSFDSFEQVLHDPLEDGGSGGHPKRKPPILKKALVGVDCYILTRLLVQRDLQVRMRQV